MNTVDITGFQAMVVTIGVTIGVTIRKKISPQAGETCGLILNYNLTLSRPSEETPKKP